MVITALHSELTSIPATEELLAGVSANKRLVEGREGEGRKRWNPIITFLPLSVFILAYYLSSFSLDEANERRGGMGGKEGNTLYQLRRLNDIR